MTNRRPGASERARREFALANQLASQGRFAEAVAHYEIALSLGPDFIEARNNLGLALASQGHFRKAIEQYEFALSVRPNAYAHNNLGNALAALGRTDEAILQFQRALTLSPDYVEAHNNLGICLMSRKDAAPAIGHFRRALELNPDYAQAYNNLGITYMRTGQIGQAIESYAQAASRRPDFAEAHNNLGLAYSALGNTTKAISSFDEALSRKPDYVAAHSNLLLALNYDAVLSPEQVHSAHVEFGRRYESREPGAPAISWSNDRSPDRRIRLGYVSSDFRQHSVAAFIAPVLECHDRVQFEIFCYANHPHEDDTTQRLATFAANWRRIVGHADRDVARQIRDDGIDILVDLNGHTAMNRLMVFAQRPAPVQVTWLGYPNTTGLHAINYRITDTLSDPPGMTERFHTETLIRLPDCFACFQPPSDAPPVGDSPSLRRGIVTFGSFNKLNKINPDLMAVWARILKAVPGSRLMLKTSGLADASVLEFVRQSFARVGVEPERLELLGHDPSHIAHLRQYDAVDISLDTFPYNGTTTTCEALWMGVPVVTLTGQVHAGRVGVSQLSCLGLQDLIGVTPDEYVAIATRLALDPVRLQDLRRNLRPRMAAAPLTDAARFTADLEQAYRAMWTDWCA